MLSFFINVIREHAGLPPVILMNTPTSELFFLKHCETAGKLTLLLKGFGLDCYFPRLYSFRIQKMSWGENWPWDLEFWHFSPMEATKIQWFFFFFHQGSYFLPGPNPDSQSVTTPRFVKCLQGQLEILSSPLTGLPSLQFYSLTFSLLPCLLVFSNF